MLTAITKEEATIRRIDNDTRETDSSPEKHIGPVNGIDNMVKSQIKNPVGIPKNQPPIQSIACTSHKMKVWLLTIVIFMLKHYIQLIKFNFQI